MTPVERAAGFACAFVVRSKVSMQYRRFQPVLGGLKSALPLFSFPVE